MRYQSTKTYTHEVGLSCCFRQWRAASHCSYLHGYALAVTLVFESVVLDDRHWVVDFGGLKEFKQWLVDQFDHKTLVAADDPMRSAFEELAVKNIIDMRLVPAVGCEEFAAMIYRKAAKWLQLQQESGTINPHARLRYVEVREHGANSARYGEV